MERNKLKILPTIFQERRKKIPKVILLPNEKVNALSFMGAKNWDSGYQADVGFIESDFHHWDGHHLKYEEILDSIIKNFGPKGKEDPVVINYFKKKALANPEYHNIFKDTTPGDFIKMDPVDLNIDPKYNTCTNPIRPINNPDAQVAYSKFISNLSKLLKTHKLCKSKT